MVEVVVGEEEVVDVGWPEAGPGRVCGLPAGPQSNMIFSPSTSATYAEPKRVGVGVGVPAPRIVEGCGEFGVGHGAIWVLSSNA